VHDDIVMTHVVYPTVAPCEACQAGDAGQTTCLHGSVYDDDTRRVSYTYPLVAVSGWSDYMSWWECL
jgi:hypothetical protein